MTVIEAYLTEIFKLILLLTFTGSVMSLKTGYKR